MVKNALYILKVCLHDYKLLNYKPDIIALTALIASTNYYFGWVCDYKEEYYQEKLFVLFEKYNSIFKLYTFSIF